MTDAHIDVAPDQPPLPLQAFIRLEPSGLHAIWLHNTETDQVIEATADDPLDAIAAVKWLRDEFEMSETQNVIVEFAASPRPGAKWQPADAMRTYMDTPWTPPTLQ